MKNKTRATTPGMKKKNKRPSIKDIADRVGVSTALVSYVLNGQEKEKRVSAEVTQRIREVVKELKYTPNQIARSLRKGFTKTLGLIVADIANPFFGSLARFIEDEANAYGYTVIIGSSDEDCEKSSLLVDTLLNRQVDGFIIVPSDGCTNHINDLVNDEMPVVLVDRYIPGITTNYVILDNFNASMDAVGHLIFKGYRRIGMIAYQSSLIHMKERVRGYCQAMEAAGLGNNILVREVRHAHLDRDMNQVLKEILVDENKVDALYFATNAIAINGLYFIQKNKIKVPTECALIGFDGNEAFDFFASPLTFIKQPIHEMAKEAVKIVVDQINGSRKVAHIMLQHELIRRQSCG